MISLVIPTRDKHSRLETMLAHVAKLNALKTFCSRSLSLTMEVSTLFQMRIAALSACRVCASFVTNFPKAGHRQETLGRTLPHPRGYSFWTTIFCPSLGCSPRIAGSETTTRKDLLSGARLSSIFLGFVIWMTPESRTPDQKTSALGRKVCFAAAI